jgi:predicted ATPase
MAFESFPLRRAHEHPLEPMPRGAWPATLAPVKQLLDEGLDFAPVTVFVGENGSGKSTLVEAIAQAYGLSAEGGACGIFMKGFFVITRAIGA